MEVNKIYHSDWMNNNLADKSVQLIIADPPYYKVKGDFDFVWKTFDDYLQDVERWAIECKRVLADNGTLYWYGDAKNIAYAQVIFDKHFNLLNSLVWENTNDHKQQIRFNPDLRTFAPLTERLLMYDNAVNKTGLQEIYSDDNCFESIKEYLRREKQKSNLTSKQLNYMFSKYTNKEGCLDRSVMEHYWQKSQWVFPTQEIYENIMQPTGFWQKPYEELRQEYEELRQEYEELRQEYEELRRPFNNERFYGDVIRIPNYETGSHEHDTPKPEKLTREIILISSRPNDLILVPFAGSGTECAMAIKENRNFIGFEINEKHVNYGNKRADNIKAQPSLFAVS
jgi:site-specific DNA-methyltransferase (adenine-specific)